MKNIKQNLFFACVYNTLGVRIAAVGLLLSTIAAAAAYSFSSFSAVGNAVRLYGKIRLLKRGRGSGSRRFTVSVFLFHDAFGVRPRRPD